MYLKRLEIKGFKSFAERTVLDFLAYKNNRYSITAIIGPNGSGKSNISDAVRWVMGEQSLKNIRGKKNEDVIFNGSETKGQLGAAEVTMVLDNSQSKLMDEYPEITITRRLYRSGEGEYLINNNPVRLLDIHLLLAKAQFAQHSYSVVGQGMIDRLLTVSPAERKEFLDAASGIKEFQIKQHQANLKLARTVENVEQAERLMQEVEPRLKILAKQVKKLEKRQEVELNLREHQEKYYASVYASNKSELDRHSLNLSGVETEYRTIFTQLEKIQNELATLARATTRQDLFNELQGKYQGVVREKNDLERQLAIKDGQMHAEYNKEGKQNLGWIENKISEIKSQHELLASQVAEAQVELKNSERLISDQRANLERISIERTECQVRISDLEKQMFQDQSEQNYRQFSGLLAVQSVLENKDKFGAVYGMVAELGQTDEKFKTALEVAAGSYLSAVVVANDDVARLAIEFLRNNRLGIATFLPLNKIQGREVDEHTRSLLSHPGVLGLACEIIKHEPKFQNIFSLVFGQTLVVENIQVAQKIGIGSARMVTLTGDLIEKSGAMKGGYKQFKKGGVGFSGKLSWTKDRLEDCQQQISAEKQKIFDLDASFEKIKIKLLELESKKETANSKLNVLMEEGKKIEQEKAGLEQELSFINADPKKFGEMLAKLSKEKDALEKEIKNKEKEIAEFSTKIDNFNKEEEEKKQKVFALQDEMQKKQNSLNQILSSRNDLKIEIAKLETKLESLEEEVAAEMNVSLASVLERKPPTVEAEKLMDVVAEIQKLKYQLSLIGGIDEEVVADYQQTKERFDFLDTQITDLRAAMADLEKMIEELDEIMKTKRAAAFKKIKKEFDRYIKILFNGGSGEIFEIYGEPEEEQELAEEQTGEQFEVKEKKKSAKILTGIDISINPPGKKIKHINTLSGGERTLASIALICAILSYNPSPFVVLDEVEAALDEPNTRRFAEIVTELSQHSQFIIITHNRVTMHSADALYGVVMGGDGISKMLSVSLEEAPKYEMATVDKRS